MMTGRLQGTLNGWPVEIQADEKELLLRMTSFRSAWQSRRFGSAGMVRLLQMLRRNGFSLRVRIGSRLTLNVLPFPSFGLRLLVPALRTFKPRDAR